MLVPARSDAAMAARTSRAVRVASGSVEAWLLAGVTAIGALLRFATLGAQSYWFDEAQAAHELHLSFGSMVSSMVVHETNPPLYFVLGWLWARVFGTGEVGLRSLSALVGTAVIPIAYLCGRELVSRRAGLLAAAFAALSPFMIWYSQEAREYMLLVALSGASLLYFAKAWNAPSTRYIALWGVFSALAVLTHFFAGFLIAPEALWLLYVIRNRTIAYAAGAVAAVQLALVPLLVSQAGNTLLGFITGTRLVTRLQQVPVAFGLGNLYQSPGARFGLLGAAVLAGAVIVLLLIGSDSRELRGAGAAAALTAVVLLLPLALALVGEDYYLARALMPAWIPLAVVVAAACTAPRARAPGAVLAVVVLASFVYGQVKVSNSPEYQRPDWRGVAAALGAARGTRAIVAYEGSLATDPLATYLPRVPWTEPSRGAVTVREVDVVGYRWQTLGRPLPAGARLISTKTVDDFVVDRFLLGSSRTLTRAQVAATAGSLLGPPVVGAAVLVQNSPSAR